MVDAATGTGVLWSSSKYRSSSNSRSHPAHDTAFVYPHGLHFSTGHIGPWLSLSAGLRCKSTRGDSVVMAPYRGCRRVVDIPECQPLSIALPLHCQPLILN